VLEENIYLDNAATTFPKSEAVYKAMDDANRRFAVNAGRGSYKLAREANAIIDDTKERLLRLVSASSTSKVVFTPSITISLNMILQGITWQKGDVVYVSPYEHNAVARTLEKLKNDFQIVVKLMPLTEEFDINLPLLESLFITDRPKCVCCTGVSNVTGYILPTKEIFKAAKECGAITILDSAQSLGIIELPEPITAVQVRDLLHTLTGSELMSGGKVKYTDTQSITSIISILHTRQNMVWDDEFTYQMNWMVLYNKVWYRSKNNSNHGKNPATETDWWESINALSGTQIAALLNSLTTINEMVIANRIKYNDSLTVAGKIEAMDMTIEKKQNRITRNRYLYSNPINGKVFRIGDKTADIFSLRINRTALEGVRADDFNVEAAAYDYIYKTIDGTDTQITLSPDLGIEFKAGTIIDVQW